MVGEGGFAFLRKSHGGCSSPPDCCQEPPFESTKKQKDKLSLVFWLATNAIFDTGCIGLQSCIEMQPKKCMQPTDKLEFMGAKQILDWGTQILLSIRLPEIQIFCTAPLVQSLFYHIHETLTP